jgi:hypothetical protein
MLNKMRTLNKGLVGYQPQQFGNAENSLMMETEQVSATLDCCSKLMVEVTQAKFITLSGLL